MKSKNFKKILIFLFLLSAIYCLLLTNANALDIKKQTLQNGLTVLHLEKHDLPIAVITLLIKASPLNEAEEKAGTAYLTARLLTEGTSNRSASEISEEIEFIGASIDISNNSDYTTISLSVLKKDLEIGLDIFSDLVLNPLFSDNEIRRKKELIKGSLMQSEDNPSFVASKVFIKEVFGTHPYGRLITGSAESIENITRDDILMFYKKYYQPQNAILTFVGNLTSDEMDSLTKKYFGQWKTEEKSQCPEAKIQMAEDERQKRIVIINKDITQANIILGHRGIARDNPDYYAVSVMNYILGGGGFASRLMRVVRDEMGLAYSIYSSFSVNKEPGQFEVEVQTKNESAGVVIKEILRQIDRIRKEPVAEQELDDAKAYLTGSFPRRLETSRKIADFIAAIQYYGLGDDYIEKYPEYIKNITKEDVLRVAKKYLDSENYVLVVVGNAEKMNLSLSDLKGLKDMAY